LHTLGYASTWTQLPRLESHRFFDVISGGARWAVYVIVVLVVVCLSVFANPHSSNRRGLKPWLVWFVPWVMPFMLSSLVNRWNGVGHEGAGFLGAMVNIWQIQIVSFLVVLCSVWLATSSSEQIRKSKSLTMAFVGVLVIAVFNSRVGDHIVRLRDELLIFVPAFVVLARLLVRQMSVSHIESSQPRSRVRTIGEYAIFLAVIPLSARIDGLATVGGWYHVGYFTGVVQTIRDGGLLLWDTPSQYGFLSLLLPAILPRTSAMSSFLWFQALLLGAVGVLGLAAIRHAAQTRRWLLGGVVFLLLLNFADPELIGPQPFPSSSVMRFGPSAILLAWLTLRPRRVATVRRWIIISAVIVTMGVLWSFESAYYCVLILVGMVLREVSAEDRWAWPSIETRQILIASAAGVTGVILLYSFVVYLRVSEFPTWTWYVLASSRYAAGHGALPTDLFGVIWVPLLGVIAVLAMTLTTQQIVTQYAGASIGAMCGWLTYYFGRSHSSNVMVIFPLLFLAVLLPTLHHVRSVNPEGGGSSLHPRPSNHSRTVANVLLGPALAFVVILGSIQAASFVANPRLPAVAARYRPIPLAPRFEYLDVEELNDVLRKLPLRQIPVAYHGNFGMLPTLAPDVAARLNLTGTWLPLPLALLEEPIPEAARKLMLARTVRRSGSDGYLIWHVSNSISGRGEAWLNDLSQSHDCQKIGSSPNWQIFECSFVAG